ncbi:hypothetical protein T310_8789, partial [Rasamsonia emersonii CBS 393.64]
SHPTFSQSDSRIDPSPTAKWAPVRPQVAIGRMGRPTPPGPVARLEGSFMTFLVVEGRISSHSILGWLTEEVGNGRRLRVLLHAGIGRHGLMAREKTPKGRFRGSR